MRQTVLHMASCALAVILGFSSTIAVAQDAIVVRSATWSGALQTWKEHRSAQGIGVTELDTHPDPNVLRDRIRKAAQELDLQFVFLVGDVDPTSVHHLPTFHLPSQAMVQFGGDEVLATDNPYVDFDDDGVPDIAIGRIPADSEQQLASYLNRVIAYENDVNYTSWQRDVHVVAGVGGFGALADSMIEMTTRRFLADRVPGWSQMTMTHASNGSIYCPDLSQFPAACLDKLNQGSRFWVYIGHGHVRTLDFIRLPNGNATPIFDTRSLPLVNCKHPPIALFLACYTGAFDATVDSLAEELVLMESGPIAAMAASRVSGPYGLAMLSDGLLTNTYESALPTLGEIVLAAKQNMLTGPHGRQPNDENNAPQTPARKPDPQIKMINAIASAMSPKEYDLFQERAEHVQMVHLLGDPMLKIAHPHEIELNLPSTVAPGEPVVIEGVSKFAGELTVELIYRRDQTRKDLAKGELDPKLPNLTQALQQRYQAANTRVLVSQTTGCPAGEFRTEITIPPELARGRYAIRLFMPGTKQFQVGYSRISVRP